MTTLDFIGEVKECLISEIKPWIESQVNEMYKNRIAKATLTVEEAAEYIGVSVSMLYIMAREKQIAYIPVGAMSSLKPKMKFRLSTLDKWMEEQERKSMKGAGA
ncbi:hypothetical protein BVG16_13625 [Paenibacillus selenitireducens]|uniref:Helix-turn-helix domain-containing protein n=1 Tax=Paenibacillus selenitireducens TaxID=1324314 RepID=A0A1T2XC75_9BACL|nr:helix-turn-helix domain-containing protein [Paenibacillus selenitireducens]OPA77489.1 hypothetical protein BVG16_13625 [Paenibacillus selenitireducens]